MNQLFIMLLTPKIRLAIKNHIQTQFKNEWSFDRLNIDGGYKMIDESEYMFSDTLKATDIKKDIGTTIKEVKTISTRYGDKRLMLFDDKQIFLNSLSLKNLVEAFGNDENTWKEKPVLITTETSERTQGKKSIVVKELPKEK